MAQRTPSSPLKPAAPNTYCAQHVLAGCLHSQLAAPVRAPLLLAGAADAALPSEWLVVLTAHSLQAVLDLLAGVAFSRVPDWGSQPVPLPCIAGVPGTAHGCRQRQHTWRTHQAAAAAAGRWAA